MMKKYLIICFCFHSLLFCKKINTDPAIEYLDNRYYTEINITYDGKHWGQSSINLKASFITPAVFRKSDSSYCKVDSACTLTLYNFHPKITLYSEQLVVTGIPLRKGKYKINSFNWKRPDCFVLDTLDASFSTSIESDAGGDFYPNVAGARDNFLTVNYYDAGKRELQGDLDVAFIAPIGPGAPADTIFLKGSFKVLKL